MGKNQWITKQGDQWAVKGEGNTKATTLHDTQKEAIAAGRETAINQKSELIIQGADGKIREKNSYGNDDSPPKG
ncbi:DUF2188 domain-containing protein [Pseudoalteromonas arctica]|uniref:DUF2188 domain-containing protein n=1 Tax=Pseudoalteromonas arctica TaxID=394751 RepID=A0A7Y0DUI5_9GAMM|nr:DUF2188 domain-containing protein [Pseudoalteromonas arctica]NMM40951.1 DUF2188 domain-containing protein [Pseudoalteromonas arctica]